MRHSEKRKFAEARACSVNAAQAREVVQHALKRVPTKNRARFAEPTDYETLASDNKAAIQSDPHKDLLRFPDDDIAIVENPRRSRQMVSGVPDSIRNEPSVSLMVKECLKTYTEEYRSIVFKYSAFGGQFSSLPHVSLPPLRELLFEVDRDETDRDRLEDDLQRCAAANASTQKRGYLFVYRDTKQLDGSSATPVNFTKAFRRRFFSLKQQPDLSYLLECYKDDKRTETEDLISLDAAQDVSKSGRHLKGKVCFEINMKNKITHLLAAETEEEAAGWIGALRRAMPQQLNCTGVSSPADSSTSVSTNGAKTASAEASFNDLMRSTKETDAVLALKRQENRNRLFYLYPDVHRQMSSANAKECEKTTNGVSASLRLRHRRQSHSLHGETYMNSQFCDRRKGKQVVLSCVHFHTKMQMNTAELNKPGSFDNPEPFFITLALYDAREGRKLSEDVHFLPNSVEVQQMIPHDVLLLRDGPCSRRPASPGNSLSTCQVELVSQSLSSLDLDAKQLAGTRCFLFNVTRPHSDVYLVARVDKVLSGALTSAIETYSKGISGGSSCSESQRAAAKQHRAMRSICAHLGHQRMPLGWAARPVFRPTVQTISAQTGAALCQALKEASGCSSGNGETTSVAGASLLSQAGAHGLRNSEVDSGEYDLTVYRCEQSRLSDEDLIKCLQELRRADRASKWQTLQINLRIKVEPLLGNSQYLANTLTSSLVPLEPFDRADTPSSVETPSTPTNVALERPLAREAEEFVCDLEGNERDAMPYGTFKNLLYVYPKHLNYSNQSQFPRARNLCCVVELRDSDDLDAIPLRAVYARPPFSVANVFGTQARTCVTHHNAAPDYYDELKFALPTNLHAKHHLLFSFYHVSCELSKSDSPHTQHHHHATRGIETMVGHTWLPLFAARRLTVGEVNLPVATQLPRNYLDFDVGLGTVDGGRSRANSYAEREREREVRWVEGAKSLFQVQLRVVSTIFTKETQVQKFFQTCERISQASSASASASSLLDADVNALKGVLATDQSILVQFAPTLLNQLFGLLTTVTDHEVAVNVTRVLVQLVALLADANAEKSDVLRWYLHNVFCRTLTSYYNSASAARTVHEELISTLLTVLKSSTADTITIDRLLQHFWFYAKVVKQSAACFLLLTNKIKMPRTERFASDFYTKLEHLILAILPLVIQRSTDQPAITKIANDSIADLIKTCFALADRTVAFRLLDAYLNNFPMNDDRVLHERRFDLLQSVSAYEHYVPLNLPLQQNAALKEFRRNFVLSHDFVREHFLVGTLLHEFKEALNESKPLRKLAIIVLRNMLAKHAFDERYHLKEKQARVMTLYLPLLNIVIDCRNRLRAPTGGISKLDSNKFGTLGSRSVDFDQVSVDGSRPTSAVFDTASVSNLSVSSLSTVIVRQPSPGGLQRQLLNRKRLSSGGINLNSVHANSNNDDASMKVVDNSVLDRIAGVAQGQVLSNIRERHEAERSELVSLASRISNGSDITINANEDLESMLDKPLMIPQSELFGSVMGDLDSQSIRPSGANTLQRVACGMLEQGETRELLGCLMYMLSAVSEDVLISWFRNATENEMLALLDVLRLALHHFMYAGRKRIINLTLIGGGGGSGGARPPSTAGITRNRATANSLRNSNRFSRDDFDSILPHRLFDDSSNPDTCNSASSENGAVFRSILEANMSAEIGLIVLDVLGIYTSHFKTEIERSSSELPHEPAPLLEKIFGLLIYFLQTNQAENTLRHVFPALRSFVQTFASTIFHVDSLTQKLCYELLRCCNSRLASTRTSACFVLYWTMRLSYETLGRTGFNRILLQLTVSVSTVATDELVSSTRFNDSLSLINSYAQSDVAMQPTALPHEVKELTKSIRTILMATAQIRSCMHDPEQNIDLHYSLARSYSRTCPALRITWLHLMADQHSKYGNNVEAALCHVHIAAMINELLRCKRNRQQHAALRNIAQKKSPLSVSSHFDDRSAEEIASCYIDVDISAFTLVSPNVSAEEVCLSGRGPTSSSYTATTAALPSTGVAVNLLNSGLDSAALDDVTFSEFDLVRALRNAARCFQQADRFEASIEIHKLLVGYFERQRDFGELASLYDTMHHNCSTLAAFAKGLNRRLLGTYFRVALHGSLFEQDNGHEFIYKEPKITTLAEIYERLQTQFARRFGRQSIKVLTDSQRLNVADLNPQIGYIQITHVTPYFNIEEHDVTGSASKPNTTATSGNKTPVERARNLVRPVAISDYEYHTNVNCFMFETPFVLDQPTKAHGSVEEQCKRRVLLTTSHCFPFIKKRIPVVRTDEFELKPIEVAIDELAKQVRQLKEILAQIPQDLKKLQLKLQGSVSVQVNAGPLAYAEAFLHPDKVWLYQLQREKVDILKHVFEQFVETCQEALEVNRSMITSEQWEYHEALKSSFEDLVRRLHNIVREPMIVRDATLSTTISSNGAPASTSSDFRPEVSNSNATNAEPIEDIV